MDRLDRHALLSPLPANAMSGFLRLGVGHQWRRLLVLDDAPLLMCQPMIGGGTMRLVGGAPFLRRPRMIGDDDDAFLGTCNLALGQFDTGPAWRMGDRLDRLLSAHDERRTWQHH